MRKEKDLENAIKLKGYGSFIGYSKNEYKNIQQVKIVDENLKVKPTIITCLNEYIDYIKNLNTSYENPVFYRGQGNANFPINPNSLRKNPANEQRLIEAFYRKFPNELDACNTDMARLVVK